MRWAISRGQKPTTENRLTRQQPPFREVAVSALSGKGFPVRCFATFFIGFSFGTLTS
jgi:hypothetical protein